MVKGIIFDYGGTLDTRGNHWGKVLWHAYERQQVPVTEEQFREAYVYAERTLGRNPIILPTYTFKKLLDVKLRLEMEYLFTKGYLTFDKNTYTKVELALLDDLYGQVRHTVAYSREILMQLHERYPMVLVSNFYGNIEVVLQEFRLEGLFQKIIESAVVGIRKPDPQIFQLGVDALGLAPKEVMVVGDSMSKDIIPAKNIGCMTAWYKGEGWTDKQEDESIPNLVITDLQDLLTFHLNF
ncbi:MAG: HAD family hydrolase [Prevotella sp.]|nr:HAD family hydrolase [Prevotella sp.]